MTKEELSSLRILFSLGRKHWCMEKETIEELLALEDKLFKELENGSLQSSTNKRTGSKKSN